jgi:hypothetical protein
MTDQDCSRIVHRTAAEGYSPTAAGRYVRGRPDYPTEVTTWLRGTLGLRAGQTVIDLGAGTGKARVKSTSFIAALPAAEQAQIEVQVRALIEAEPTLRGHASVTVPYESAAFVTVKETSGTVPY